MTTGACNRITGYDLRNKGAIFVEELEEIEDKTRPVIFSAHGVPKKIPQDAKNYNMTYVDATCPLVSKVHREAENLHKAGYHLILIGHENHPEVIGTMGQLPKGSIDLIQNEDEAIAVNDCRYDGRSDLFILIPLIISSPLLLLTYFI